ncbi:MAG TPA: pectinesterase family protein [Verrucomicrobiae bacterium]|nr:pectinesterase family protein [Verrucomicrobiae bacterium]
MMKITTLLRLGLFASIAPMLSAQADTVVWFGTGPDSNWSTGSNWTNSTAGVFGTAPGATDDTFFFDATAANPTVDDMFGGTIASLRFGSTNNDYVTSIPAGTTLNVTGAGGLAVGTIVDPAVALVRSSTFVGSGALNLNHPAARLTLNQGTASLNGSHAILNLQGLDTFIANINSIGIGTVSFPNAVAQRNSGTLYLARTNVIALSYTQPLSVYMTVAAATNAIEMVQVGAGNNAGTRSFLYLGQTNAFFVDSMGFGRSKASANSAAVMSFDPGVVGASPIAVFRGVGGSSSRVTWWGIGDMSAFASSAQHAVGTNDFTGGYVDALVDVMSLGRDCSGSHTASGGNPPRINTGVLTFDNGRIDVNNLFLGNQALGPSTSVTPNMGIMNVNGSGAELVVNNTLTLASTIQSTTAAQATTGILNINAGTVRANMITVGAASLNQVINVVEGGTLAVSNTLGASKPLRTLMMSDSSIELHLTGAGNIASVTNLVTGGGGNTINIGSSILFSSYPAQVALFKYTTLSNMTAGLGHHNFALGALPASLAGATLSNNTFNSSIDLYIPNDPRPTISEDPSSFSGPPGSLAQFSVAAAGIQPLAYQWRRNDVDLSDVGGISGSATDTLTINSAQVANSGDYTVVITNVYGAITSSVATLTISAGNVAPVITGPNNLAVLQGQDATFTASVSGVPSPAIQWRKNGVDIPGAHNSSYTVENAQYPADQTTYSIVATNVAGAVTNSATLTVLVPPVITEEPVNVTAPQGTPASFHVVATGNPPPTYQWVKNSGTLSGATNATLSFASVQPSDAGTYAVLVNNDGGSDTSVTVSLTVTSTNLAAIQFTPAGGSGNVCYDTPLYIRFNKTPVLGTGTLRIYNADDALVDTIDLGLNDNNGGQLRVIAGGSYNTYPVIIRSNIAAIFPHLGMLASNTTYYVLMDAGFFKDSGGASEAGISDPNTWRFTTKTAGPDAASVNDVVVASDGSGDFVTVQGAIDWVPAGNTTPRHVLIRKGTYEEINRVPAGKDNLTFSGEGYQESVLVYANNNTFQGANAGTSTRVMFFAGGSGLVFRNLVFTNSTPQGGSQAEAVRAQGSRIILDNCKLASFQDTLLINTGNSSAAFVNKGLIQGDVDFIWGSGIGYFYKTEIRAMQRAGNAQGVTTQARTPAGVYGLIFVECALTRSSPAVNSWSLGRDANTSGPDGNVAYLKCLMDSHIIPAGWTDGGLADKSTLRFWEYQTRDITGTTLLDVSARVPWSRQLSEAEYLTVSNPTNVFASIGWEPVLAPYIAGQPEPRDAIVGQTVTLRAAVGGIPEPSYQWYRGAMAVPGGTNETLVIPNAQMTDSGLYSLRVTNSLGYAISDAASVSVGTGVSPMISNMTRLSDGNVAFSFSGAAGQPYRLWASSDLLATPVANTWTLLSSGAFDGSAVPYTDSIATNHPQRFYIITVP